MNGERKIIVYIATSADGYIARADGNVDWLNRPRTAGDYGMGEFSKSIDTVLWGRKTYEPVLQAFASKRRTAKRRPAKEGKKARPGKIKNYVFSHRRPENIPPGVEFVTSSIKDFAQSIRAEPGKNIWMMGGAGIIGSFLDENEIDEFMIHVIPTFIGEGVPLIQPGHRTVPLKLIATHEYADGVVKLHYEVMR